MPFGELQEETIKIQRFSRYCSNSVQNCDDLVNLVYLVSSVLWFIIFSNATLEVTMIHLYTGCVVTRHFIAITEQPFLPECAEGYDKGSMTFQTLSGIECPIKVCLIIIIILILIIIITSIMVMTHTITVSKRNCESIRNWQWKKNE